MKYDEFIHDRGRGPEIKGTRITVYDIVDYLLLGWPKTKIATWLAIHSDQVQAAKEYILENRLEVMTQYVKCLEREAQGNPPEIQARLDACRGKARELAEKLRQKSSTEESHAGTTGGP